MKSRLSEYSAAKSRAVLTTGETIRMLRDLKGWTQAELARKSGISVTNISLLENEKVDLWRPGELSPSEYELVKTHAERGYESLRRVEFPWPVAEVVREHHERLDGSGYPRGLKGEEILLEARIVAVADAAEAMLAPRPQRAALSPPACVEELQSQAGRRYDARVVKACVKLLRERHTRTEGEASVGQRIA